MKLNRENIQKILIFLLILSLPLGKRHLMPFIPRGNISLNSDFLNIFVYISDLVLIIALLFSISANTLTTWWNSSKKSIKVYILLISWTIISILVSSLPREAFNWFFAIKLAELLILALFIAEMAKNISLRKVLGLGLVVSGLIQAILGIAQFVLQRSLNLFILGEPVINRSMAGIAKIDLNGDKYIRAYGTFGHPNELAAFLLVACATAIYMFIVSESKKARIFYLFALSITILGVFVSFSRAGIVALIISLVIIFTALAKQNRKTQEIDLRSLILISLTSVIFFSGMLYPYLRARVSPTPTQFSRTFYNKAGWEIFKQNPSIGVGAGNIIPAMAKTIQYEQVWQVQPPHMYLLIVACETGIVGLGVVLYIFMSRLVGLMKQLWLGDTEEVSFKVILLGSFTSILLLMFFDHYFYTAQQTQLLLWLVIGMISGQIKKQNT